MRVAIIGAGLMGAQIGCEYALGRHDVVFHARDLDGVRVRVDAAFALVSAHGLRSAETAIMDGDLAADTAARLARDLRDDHPKGGSS